MGSLQCGDRLQGNTRGLRNQIQNPGGDAIYEFVATTNSYTFNACRIDTNKDYDSFLSVWSSNGEFVGKNDDHYGQCGTSENYRYASYLELRDLNIGEKYWLVVEGKRFHM